MTTESLQYHADALPFGGHTITSDLVTPPQSDHEISPISENAGGADFRAKLVELIPFLRAFARTLSGRHAGADDLCQEALVRAWQSRATFEPGTNLKAWLFAIMRNQFYSERRRSWRQEPWDESAVEHAFVTPGAQDATMALSDVARAMRSLPNEQREALILVAAGGFAYEEAAKISGCAVGTIKSRVARGRRALEESMDGTRKLPERRARLDGHADLLAQLDCLMSHAPAHEHVRKSHGNEMRV